MGDSFRIPQSTVDAVVRRFGGDGKKWVSRQEEILVELAAKWGLAAEGTVEGGLPLNAIFLVSRGGEPLVLKTGYPEPELFTELAVLKLWRGREHCVQLVDCDEVNGIALMERLEPGRLFRHEPAESRSVTIPPLFDATPLSIVDHEFPSYREWADRAFTRYRQSGDVMLLPFIERAESCLNRTLASHTDEFLLHGDLHHENMLLRGNDWVAIDPKGVRGPAVLEHGRFMHNFIDDEKSQDNTITRILQTRARTLAGDYGVETLMQVGYIDLVLAICWTLNDGDEPASSALQMLGEYALLVQ